MSEVQTRRITVLSVFSTRPGAIKMAPVVRALEKSQLHESVVCVTGQHREMLDQILENFQTKVRYDLDVMKAKQSLSQARSFHIYDDDCSDVPPPPF